MTELEDRREEEKEQRRQDILDAARKVFARDGVQGATMAAVGKAARLSRALIYFYFEDKEDLRWALAEVGLNRLYGYFEEAVEAADNGLDALGRIGHAYVRLRREHRVEWETIMHKEAEEIGDSLADLDPDSHEACAHSVGMKIHRLMADQVERGMEDGSIRADIDDPLRVALTLWAFTHGILQVTSTKELLFRHYGVEVEDFIGRGIAMAGAGIAGHPKGDPA